VCVCVSCMFIDQEVVAAIGLWYSGCSFLVCVKWNETITVCAAMQDKVFSLKFGS
jgi:D-Tyr-tRNAtyr deacylase